MDFNQCGCYIYGSWFNWIFSKETRMNFAVFASGNGGNLQAIINACKAKKIKAQLKVVFSDKKDAFALERARKAGIICIHLSPKEFPTRDAFDLAVIAEL